MDNVIDFNKMKEEMFEKKEEETKKHVRAFLINAYTDGGFNELEKSIGEVVAHFDDAEKKRTAISELIMVAREVIGSEAANELTKRHLAELGLEKTRFIKKKYSDEERKKATDFFKERLMADEDVFTWDYDQKKEAVNLLAIRASNDKEVLEVETQDRKNMQGTIVIKDGAELMNAKMAIGLILLNADDIKITTQYAKDGTSVIILEYSVISGNKFLTMK